MAEPIQRWGYIDQEGNVVIPIQYEKVERFADGLGIVTQDGLSGYMDRHGKWKLPPRFEGLGHLENGRAFAIQDEKWGCVDHKGNWLLPPIYGYFGSFYDGLARVEIDGLDGFMDESFELVIPPRYEYAKDFKEGFALVTEPGKPYEKWFIDKTGRMAYGPYRSAESFSEGWALFHDNGQSFYIDADGKTVLELSAGMIGRPFREGLAVAETRISYDEWLFGFIDRSGEWVIEPQFTFALGFGNGSAAVEVGEKVGRINKEGRHIVPLGKYDRVEEAYDGRMKFRKKERAGYLDELGRVAIKAQYDLAADFSEGLGPVCLMQ